MKKSTKCFVIAAITATLAGCGGAGQFGNGTSQASSSELEAQAKIVVSEPDEVKGATFTAETIGNDRRKAVFYEAFYALRQSWLNPPNENGPYGGNQIDGGVVGDWSYLASDTKALSYVTGRIGRNNASITSLNMATSSYDMLGGFERAGQCLFFANLILRRSLTYDLPVSWSSYPTNGATAKNSQPGDVAYYRNYPSSGMNHIGIVVLKTSAGMDIVDSNFLGYKKNPVRSGYYDSEVIGRHWVSNADIDKAGWKVYSGKGKWY